MTSKHPTPANTHTDEWLVRALARLEEESLACFGVRRREPKWPQPLEGDEEEETES